MRLLQTCPIRKRWLSTLLIFTLGLASVSAGLNAPLVLTNTNKPPRIMRLIFIHHSTGEAWLADDHGGLGMALRDNNYFVSDTNYGWGPDGIGDITDIGHWWLWFRGPDSSRYLAALDAESGQNCSYSRLNAAPAGANQIIMFKSCFPNSAFQGSSVSPIPPIASNPLRGQDADSNDHTISNAKGIYLDLLNYFGSRTNTYFVAITAPPLSDPVYASNARAFNEWLVHDWLKNYPFGNVYVWDFYNVLTSNGGQTEVNDLNRESGNHHRWWQGADQHKTNGGANVSAYPSSDGDDHPNAAGDVKATAEYVPLLNAAINAWLAGPDSAPQFSTARVAEQRFEITITGLKKGANYVIQRCPDLRLANWTTAENLTAQDTSMTWSAMLDNSPVAMFYRLRGQ